MHFGVVDVLGIRKTLLEVKHGRKGCRMLNVCFILKFHCIFPCQGLRDNFHFQGQFIQGLSSRLKGKSFWGCLFGALFMNLKFSVIVSLWMAQRRLFELNERHSCHTENVLENFPWLGIRSKEILKEKLFLEGMLLENVVRAISLRHLFIRSTATGSFYALNQKNGMNSRPRLSTALCEKNNVTSSKVSLNFPMAPLRMKTSRRKVFFEHSLLSKAQTLNENKIFHEKDPIPINGVRRWMQRDSIFHLPLNAGSPWMEGEDDYCSKKSGLSFFIFFLKIRASHIVYGGLGNFLEHYDKSVCRSKWRKIKEANAFIEND